MYKDDTRQLNELVNRYNLLAENYVVEAYKLMKDSLQLFNRWSYIRAEYRKGLRRGEKAEEKDRLEDICRYLKEVHTDSRMIWRYAKEDYLNNKEEI